MLCTSCREPVRPVVALDIDGTLGDWHRHWFDFADSYFNRRFLHRYVGAVRLHEHMAITLEQYRQAKLVFRQGGYKRTMPLYPGAQLLVAAIRTMDAELWITTTRPYMRLDNTDPDTREWLARNEIYYDGLLYDEDKYAKLAEIVDPRRIVAVLDDEAECYDRAEDLGLHPILIQRQHNTATRRPVEAMNLGVAKKMILERVQRWKDNNARSYQ